jgi:phage portal protein BeeE
MASERARAGGGREIALTGTGGYSLGVTNYGGGNNAATWFGPGQPQTPQAPADVAGRAFDFPSQVNMLSSGQRHSAFGFDTLRAFADGYDLLRLVIETRKDAMERLRWVIQLRDSKERITPQKRNRINEITKFFLKPDKEHNWNSWLRMLLEDLFVIDAVSIHRRRTRGGKLYALDQIDGSTVRRVLDDWGRTPEDPDATAYQQILKGIPAVNYRASDLFYRPRNLRIHKIYGFSPVEQIMMTVNIAIRRQVWQLNFFTEGNMPNALIGVPEQWTPDQIRVFQEWFDGILAGDLGERRRARFVPAAVGKTYIPTQEAELFGKAEEWLARVICFAFSISPQPFLQMMNRATADTAQQEAAATGLAPIQNWVKALIDDILAEEFGSEDLEFVWRGDDELDPVKRQAITEADVKVGLLTVNEGRIDNGREPYDNPIFDEPMFMTSNGMAPMIVEGQLNTLQGGDPKNPAGNTTDATENGPGAPKDVPADTVQKTLAELIEAGDEEALASYLRKLEQGANS